MINSPTEETRRVVNQYLTALGAGEIDTVAGLFAETFDWKLNWPVPLMDGDIPWIRQRSTAQGVAEHYRSIAEHNQPVGEGTTVDRILVDGQDAVILGTIRQMIRATDQVYEAPFALHLTVEGGRVTRHHVYEDSLSVWLAWNAPTT